MSNKKLNLLKIKNNYFKPFCNAVKDSKVRNDYSTEQTTIDYCFKNVTFHSPILKTLGITDLFLNSAINDYIINNNNEIKEYLEYMMGRYYNTNGFSYNYGMEC